MLQMVNHLNIKQNSRKNTRKSSTTSGDADRPLQATVPTLNIEVTIPLKYLSTFSRFLDLPFIKYETELDLTWKKDCVLTKYHNITDDY